jgi:hypothetical protein
MGTVPAVMPTLSRSNTTKWPNGPRTSAVEPGAGSPLGGVRLPTNRVPRRFCVRASGDPRPARSGPRVRRPPSPAADSRRAWHRYRGRSLSLKGDRLPPVGAKRWPNHDQKAGGGRRVGPSPSPRKTMCGPALRSCRAAAHFPYPYDPRTAERLIRFAGLLELAGKTRPPPAPTAVIGRPSRDGDFGRSPRADRLHQAAGLAAPPAAARPGWRHASARAGPPTNSREAQPNGEHRRAWSVREPAIVGLLLR